MKTKRKNTYGEFGYFYKIYLRKEKKDRHRADITSDRLVVDAQ
jgi:hypothetical protein